MARRATPPPPPAAPAGTTGKGPLAAIRRRRARPKFGPDGRPTGRIAQMRQVYSMTRREDPSVRWWMLGVVVAVFAVAVPVGFLVGHPIYLTVIALPLAVLGAMVVLARKAEAAAYKQIEGRPGAAGAALRSIRRGWDITEEPVAVDPRTQDSVFRGVGRAGVVLVGDGPPHRVGKLLEAERRKVTRVLPSVPVHVLQAGTGEDQVPLAKLPRKVQRLKPVMTKNELSEVNRRLKAIGGMRLPVPKGIDPMRARPDRKAVRGR
ncbi:DUF4191 domain-containing protein [Pseudokineococcus lusitanus]|jgi:hypothetical protein|uniref:Uncharacterized protein DUF4191 n=1 Tax=Pseudokineococcus lusitanus TaxID=763993 RepID=A0A3N1HT96_9ACTN|nr:DUF4191 domain-containing protein [Pseudokineococcus lusitanus]ROP45741.1 uncharacterized protein DUF4191 [Pseudokineococcus lusitanus]